MPLQWDFEAQKWANSNDAASPKTSHQETPEARAARGETAQETNWDAFYKNWESDGFVVLPVEKKKFNGHADKASVEEVESALSFISPDVCNSDWVLCGFALKDEFGDAGFEIWNSWSAKGEKYKPREIRTRWNSFGRRDGITIGSLFYLAQQEGWLPSLVTSEPIPDFVINGRMTGTPSKHIARQVPWAKKTVTAEIAAMADLPKTTDLIHFPQNLLKVPGLPGQFAAFINRTSLMPQPILAVGAAISAAGALMGRKVRSDTNLRTNFYIIGLAPSGSGKDHARTIIKRLFHDTGIGNLELGVPASSAGLISGLRDRGEGRGLVLWDEFGRVLKQISGWKSGSHEKDIVTALMELFSSAQSVYLGKSYANHDNKNPLKPIDQPCLSIYATSVPVHFYEALSNGEAIDGFLARWLIFESKDYTMEEDDREESFAQAPQSMIDLCKYWKEQPFTAEEPTGNLGGIIKTTPRLVKSSPAAMAYLKEFAAEMRKLAMASELGGDVTGPIWSRAGEHARRLALVAHEGDQVELNVAEWAVAMARYCCKYMASAIGDYVSSTELEANTKRILRAIKDKSKNADNWVTKADITRAFQGLQARTRNEILSSLAERGEIIAEKAQGTKGAPMIRFRAS